MSFDLPVSGASAQAHRAHVPAVPRTTHRACLWPRLLAHDHGDGVDVAIERSDHRLYHARRLARPFANGLTDALHRYIESTGQAVAAGVLVVDGPVTAGRFHAGASPHGTGIEGLRLALGLHTLRVIDEATALRRAAVAPLRGDVDWVLGPAAIAPATAAPTVLCRTGSDTASALLAPVGPRAIALHTTLMRYPFAPIDDDEHLVAAFLRSQGSAPVFGQLLGTAGIARAFKALAGHDEAWPGPLPAAAVVALAARDDVARRACAVVCGAIAQLAGLLSLDGAGRVLLAGPAAALLLPSLRQYPIAERLRSLGGTPIQLELGVLATPLRTLAGASSVLDQAMRELFRDTPETVGDRVRTLYAHLTPSERRVADLVLSDPAFATSEAISVIARAAGVSQPQVIRFCRTLGYGGLTDFKLSLVASLARSGAADAAAHRAPLRG
jgi:glucokinase